MQTLRFFVLTIFILAISPVRAAESDEWATFGRILALMQGFLQIPSDGRDDPARAEKYIDGVISGNNADANRMMDEAFDGMPKEQRRQVMGIARQLAVLGQRQAEQDRKQAEVSNAVQARKELAGIGLSYFDRQQFLDAIRRNDLIAVRLYRAGRGVDMRGAREIARNAGLADMELLLAEDAARNP
jgi:hypothetical protein